MSTSRSLGRSRTLLGRKTVRGSPWSGKAGRSESGLRAAPRSPRPCPLLGFLSWAPRWEGWGDIRAAQMGVCVESCGCWAFNTALALAVHIRKPRVTTGSTPTPGFVFGPGTSSDPTSSALCLLEPVRSCTCSRYRETEVKPWGSSECSLGFLPKLPHRHTCHAGRLDVIARRAHPTRTH